MAATESAKLRTYGNWREPRTAGIGSLDFGTTMALLGGMIVLVVLLMATNIWIALAGAALLALILFSVTRKDKHGRSLMSRAQARLAFRRGHRAKTNVYRSGPLGFTPWGKNQLPGLLAQTVLTEHRDSWDRPFGLIHLPSKNHFTVVFQGDPDGASLVDQSQVDLWVAHWGQWLNALGNEPGAVAASVTVETAPDFGARLRREVESTISPTAPALARSVMSQIVEEYPRGSATVRAFIAVTFRGQMREGGQRRTTEDVAHDLASRIGLMSQQLSGTGAGAVRPLSALELCEVARVAYDPAVAGTFADARAKGESVSLDWSDVGPVGADAGWNFYRHDSGYSRTWQMSQAPRGEVYSNVLQRLLEPHSSVDRKRVTLLYRPVEPGRAAELVERDRAQAQARTQSAMVPSMRSLTEHAQAVATAQEEARGAGLVNFGMVVTATVLDEARMPDAAAAIENLAASARLFLRPMSGSQDSGFAAALPFGLVLSDYMLTPSAVLKGM
ncbi:hypothetical protein PYV02_14740 [Leifsonia sp. H3M29-4]|uniref:SCO6880 family protein n=1 Tax=Salinibacterium metalliresistens TaxID=3031321 RepID=UPI0023DB52E5|nr:SCO6880 family protein [Salinibacterium metalliresistens]MDF1480340.1 hypothetical protein [Salinibacterium metalliresistens]